MRSKITLFVILCSLSLSTRAQEYAKYEPSDAYPFGRANPNAPEQIKDFAPMIGKCTCSSVARNPDQSWAEPIEMTWTFKYIMNGYGVQDETIKEDGGHSGSIRQYIADSARWYVHYYSNLGPSTTLSAWEGNLTKEKDKIVLYRDQTAPNGMEGLYRITFYDFTDVGYKWIGEWTDKTEQIVFPIWKIDCKRKDE